MSSSRHLSPLFVALALAAVVAAPTSVQAAPAHTCERVENELIEVDGMLDDWRGNRGQMIGSGRDLAMKLRCAYDDSHLYLSVNVADERLVRSRRANPREEDHLDVTLGRGKPLVFRVFPGEDGIKGKITLGGGRVPAWLQAAETLQKRGWSFELAVPLARVPGWSRNAGGIPLALAYADADLASARKIEDRLAYEASLELAGSAAVMNAFFKASGLSRADIRFDELADVDGDGKVERVLAGGRLVAVVRDQYSWVTLPIERPTDVVRLQLVDLAGDGRAALLVHYRQQGGGGSRDVVGIWYIGADGSFKRVLGIEVRKQLGDYLLTNEWKLVPRGKHRKVKGKPSKRGHDLLVEAGQAIGWDEDNYAEVPAPDARPILKPWEDQTSAVYWFEAGAAHGGDPKRGR